MATVPTWDYGVGRHSLSNFDRSAQLLTERGIANDQFRADIAKMGGIDKYRKALVDFEKAYINYQIDFAKENGYLKDLSNAYQKAIDSGFFSSSEVNSFKKSYDKLQPQIAEAARQKEADQLAKEQRQARLEAAASISGPLLNQAGAESNALITKAQGERDAAKKQIESQYQEDYKTINDLYNAGQITKAQRDVARDQAEANWSSAMQTVDANFTAAKNSINNLYEKNESYIKSLDADIRSGKASPTGKYTINSTPAGLKPITANYSVASAAIPAVEDLPEQQPEVDPYAGMTIQERMDAKKAEAQARIDEAMSRPQPVVEARSYQDIVDDIIAERQAPESGFGIDRATAQDLAKEIAVFGNIGTVNVDGQVSSDPIDAITNMILTQGLDSTINNFREQGVNFYGDIPEGFITDETASGLISQLYQSGGYTPGTSSMNSWNDYLQKNGPEALLAEWSRLGNKGTLTPEQIAAFDSTSGFSDLIQSKQNLFDTNIQNILSGNPVRPVYEGLSPEDAITQAFTAGGQDINRSSEEFNKWVDYANTFGVDTALAKLDEQLATFGSPAISGQIQQPQEAFAPRGIFEADFSGITNVPTQEQYTTSGIYQAPSFIPPAQAPTTGLPAITSAFPTTYQPAPYTPPPLIAAAPGRPTLTPAQEVIGAPDVGRPVGAPMQALTAQQAGSQFVTPTQEDYFAYFGYTPEQLNAAQFLAEMEGAPRAGIAAQTVPVLPAAVTGAPAPTGMKEGGSVGGLKAAAQELQDQGRGEDTMLIHMSPQEISGLQSLAQQMGGTLTINPQTGLPEADFFNRVGRGFKKIVSSPIGRVAVAALAAPYLPAIAGSSAITAGLLAGAGTMLGGGSLQQGLQTGLMAGMGASAAQSMGYQGIPGVQTPAQAAGVAGTGSSAMGAGVGSQNIQYMPSAESQAAIYNQPIQNLAPPPTESFLSKITPDLSKMDLGDAAMLGYVGMGAMGLKENQQAQEEYEQYLANQAAERERRKRAGTEAFERAFAAEGGLVNFAGGGMTYAEGGGTTGQTNEPRMVKGTGDGMSDSVPATIEGVQEARLANDEFVIPADVVADLGNGSSSAGAQQLYDMMDRVRQARHGTTEQPPEIDVRKIMPA